MVFAGRVFAILCTISAAAFLCYRNLLLQKDIMTMTIFQTAVSRPLPGVRWGAALLFVGLAGLLAIPSAQADSLISQGKPVTATDFYNSGGGEVFPASNITDGQFNDTGTPSNWSFWLTPNGQTGSATIDLGSLYTIDEFQIQDTHNRGYDDRGTNAFDISVSSDDITFTPVVADSFGTWPNLPIVTENSFAPVNAQYVKFNIDTVYGSSGGLNELQVFGSPAAVPEASTTISFGLLLALGFGGVTVAAKRKKSAAQA
jgi:hypothetical protein